MAILTREEYDKLKKQNEKSTSQSTIMTKSEYDKVDKTQLFSGSVLKKYNESLVKKNLVEKQSQYDKALNQNLQNIKVLNLDYSLRPFSTGTDKTLKTGSNYLPTAENLAKVKQNQEIINNSSKVQESREATNKALNDLRLAQYQYNVAKEANHTPNWFDKSIGAPLNTAKGFLSELFSPTQNRSQRVYVDENGNKKVLPSIYKTRGENIRSSYDTSFGRLYYDIADAGTKILGSSVLPGGSIMYWGDMFTNNLENTINEGYDDKDALLYSTLSTASELITSKLMGGLSKLVPGGSSNLSKTINKVLSKVMKNDRLRSTLSNALSEGSEEFVQEYVDLLNRNLVLGENNNLFSLETFENALYSGLVGMGTGGISGAVNVDVNTNNTGIIPQVDNNGNVNIETYTNQLEDALNKETNPRQAERINDTLNILNMESDNIFSRQVDKVLNGTYPERDMLVVSKTTPEVLQEIGLSNLPITMTQKHLKTIMNSSGQYKNANYHNLGIDVVKQLPRAIAEPLNILKSNTKDNSIVVVTDLADSQERPIIASIKIDGKGVVQDVRIDTNVMTSAYGRNNYDKFMQDNIAKGNLLYDIDEGIIKSSGKLQLQPTTYQKKSSTGDRVQFPTISNTRDRVQFPMRGNSISYVNNDTIKPSKSQIAPLPNTSNMQNNQDNSINVPPVKNNTKLTNKAKKIAKTLNESIKGDSLDVKQRKWIETSLESEVVKDKVLLQDLDVNKINYVVQSNKKTLDKANSKLKSMGYETSVEYIKSKINDNDISLTDIALAERLVQEAIKKGDTQLASDLIMDTAILGTDLGQKVQALSMIQRLTPEGQLKFFQKFVQRAKAKGDKSFQNVEITPEMVDLILNAYKADGTFDQNDLNDRVEQFKKKVAEQLVTTKSEKIVAWRYLSMLGNAKTHIRNIVSNVAMWGTLKVKNATARTLETLLPVKNRTKTWKKASQEVSNYAKQVTQEMKGVITGENKYNEKTSIESKKQIFKNKALEKIKDFNSNMLTNEDWLFSRTAFENTFKEYLTAQGIETKADIDNNSKIIEKAKLYALEQAEIATFRQYSWLANQISKIENKNFATKLVIGSTIPFKKTPINIAKTGASYSPLGLLKTVSYDAYQVSKGNMEASQFIDNLSQGITGTSLTLIGYALAKAGLLKGAGDDDKEGKYDSYLGNQSYSIKIGDSTYSISWLSPVAMPLLVGATAYEKLEEQSEWDMNVIIDTLAQTLDPLSEMSFLSSLDDVLSSYDSGIKKFAGMAGSMAQNYITQFIPTLFSQIASTLDNKKRTTRASNNSSWKFGEETIRKIMYKLPIARNQLEVSTDIWGNDIEQSDNIIERAFENFIAPYTKKEDISTGLDGELKRLYNATGETGVIPGVPKAFIKYEDVTYQLSADEYTQLKKTYGTIANEYLQSLVKNKNYKNATDEEKANMVKEIFEYASVISKEEYFKDKDVKYTTDTLVKVSKLRELGMNTNQLTEYVSNQKVISTIRNNQSLTTEDKKIKISDLLVDADLNDKQLAFLYGSYYSSEKTLNGLLDANIPIKEFIKFNSQEFTTDYYDNGKAVTNSRKNKVIKYVNSLNLSIPQKAILIKMEYSSYDNYNSQIVNYINKMNYSKFEKASLLKSFGFDNYDKYLINYVNNMNISKDEKTDMLEELGFTIRDGRVYY